MTIPDKFPPTPVWNQRVTICVDARRIKYCAEQLQRVSRPDTQAHRLASTVIDGISRGYQTDAQYRYALEKCYRELVLRQQTI